MGVDENYNYVQDSNIVRTSICITFYADRELKLDNVFIRGQFDPSRVTNISNITKVCMKY